MAKNSFRGLIQGNHAINDDSGRALSPGFEYTLSHGVLVDDYIADGRITVLDPSTPETRLDKRKIDSTPDPLVGSKTSEETLDV